MMEPPASPGRAGMNSLVQISKKEAVERLLAQAIKLHFDDGDNFATHLLLMSAFRVCRDLTVKHKLHRDLFNKFFKPEEIKPALKSASTIVNYLKHADNDDPATLDVPIRHMNEILISITITSYKITFDVSRVDILFSYAESVLWFKYPETRPDRSTQVGGIFENAYYSEDFANAPYAIDRLYRSLKEYIRDPNDPVLRRSMEAIKAASDPSQTVRAGVA